MSIQETYLARLNGSLARVTLRIYSFPHPAMCGRPGRYSRPGRPLQSLYLSELFGRAAGIASTRREVLNNFDKREEHRNDDVPNDKSKTDDHDRLESRSQ